jgi:hypothetical protein
MDQHRESRGSLDEGADRRALQADEQVAFRKSVARPGGSGVAEVALRFGR